MSWNWGEGGKTIRGDPIVKLDYFATADGRHENGKANWQNASTGQSPMSVEDRESFELLDEGHGSSHH